MDNGRNFTLATGALWVNWSRQLWIKQVCLSQLMMDTPDDSKRLYYIAHALSFVEANTSLNVFDRGSDPAWLTAWLTRRPAERWGG